MQSQLNLGVPVYLKNSSVGLLNNTYDIYIQVVPSLKTSQTVYREKFIPYDGITEVGFLNRIEDIKIRGSSVISGWTHNKEFLDNIKQDAVNGINTSEGSLLFIVSASLTGFYLSYYNWRPNELRRLGLKRNNDSGEYLLYSSHIDEPSQLDGFKPIG